MRLGIMQPYFLPFIGYFQLIAEVDHFIIYDNIKYTKKGWINRNRMLLNGTDTLFSLPLKKASDSLDVGQREISPDFDRTKLLNQFKGAYQKAPYFEQTFALLNSIIHYAEKNLFRYIHHSITVICRYLDIGTKIHVSSCIGIDHELKSADRVIALCKAMNAKIYINPIGGTKLYDRRDFSMHGIDLRFIKTIPFEYQQFGATFVPFLSIVDVLMFNSPAAVRDHIQRNFEMV
ncbi:MAG: WbqC family protein [Roseomonas sp.]